MKKVHLILQSKGGVGKSLLMWFIAQIEKENNSIFIDLDESTETSATRLGSVVGAGRVRHFKILNENKKLEREKILNLFEVIAETKTENWFIDFGASESEEFRRLLEFDISAQSLITELKSMNIELQIYVIIAGRDTLITCLKYYNALKTVLKDDVFYLALMNEGTFGGIESIEQGKENLKNAEIDFKCFGGIGESESGKDIIRLITESKDPSTLNFAGRLTYRKALEQVQNILSANG
jgi:hypothetical protein